jgi:predicted enzyme related to lactoylglutathione lyase
VNAAAQNVGHFAIECDDVERAKAFYEAVFGWTVKPWGPPNYYHITTGTPDRPGILGDLRQREHELERGAPGVSGYVCTINVVSFKDVLAATEANGGTIHAPPYRIENVGTVAYIEDSEGNRVGVMEAAPGRQMPEGVEDA